MSLSMRASPTVRRRRLALELRRLREAAGLTIEQAAEALECSDSKISRIETARVRATPRDVRDMLELYGVDLNERQDLIQLARDARERGWWRKYGDVAFLGTYVDLEDAAASIHIYAPLVIPGLLQTREHARAVLRAVKPHLSPNEIERQVELRMARQELLTQDQPPALYVVLDEGLLRRPVGGPEAMTAQLHRLADVAALPNIELQVLPFVAGEHAGMVSPFTVFVLTDPADPDVVFLEHTTGDVYLESPEEIHRYTVLFDRLRAAALKPDDSAAFITRLAESL